MVKSIADTPNALVLCEDFKILLLRERNKKLGKMHNI